MSEPINQFSFSSGELSPQLWDRVDMAKYHSGAALMKNFFVDFRGGASNRPGTKYVLQSHDSTYPSRLIPFTFSTQQTYALQFGYGTTLSGSVVGYTFDPSTNQILLQVASTAGMTSGNRMTITGTVTSNHGGPSGSIDGSYLIQVVDSTHVILLGTRYLYPYSSGGTYTILTGSMRVYTNGAPVLNPQVSITAVTNASPGVVTYALVTYPTTSSVDPSNGDVIYLSNMTGMSRLQGRFAVVTNVNTVAKTFQLYDLFGSPIDTTNYGTYGGGGLGGTVYSLNVPYSPTDLAQLRFTQSNDVMTLVHTLYQPAQLTRTADNAWVYAPLTFAPTISPPASVTATNNGVGTQYPLTAYSYAVTATVNGIESRQVTSPVIKPAALSQNTGAQNTVSWPSISGTSPTDVVTYSVYRTQEAIGNSTIPSGALYGFIGTVQQSATNTFIDNNIAPDFTRTPPLANNPFSGADWPGSTTYYQGRQVYAGTANEPNRIVFSRSADFLNMDYSSPTRADDSIDVTLEATQLDSIRHLVPLQALIAFSSAGVWRVDTGDTMQAMTPSNVMARPQGRDGCSDVPPLVIDTEILFVQNLQSTVRAMKYDFLMNLFRADNELTLLSNHFVFGHQIVEWAWAQQPFRILWCVRDDGVLLSLTYLPAQNLAAWTQHSTNGKVLSICSVIENNEHAVYMIVQRLIRGVYVNYVERLASRVFSDISQAFFVDAGLSYPLVYPAATATPTATGGNSTLASAANVVFGGQNYSGSTVANVIDAGATVSNPGGSGSTVTLTIVGGVITGATCTPGSGWIRPEIVVTDPTGAGSGAVITPIVQQLVTLNASASVFNAGTDIGKTVRINGGVGTVTAVNSATQAVINVSQNLTNAWAAASGSWSMTKPVTSVSGLDHLEGQTVAILANGGVQPQQVVTNGTVTLSDAADAIAVGLPYTSQIDSLYIDVPGQEEPTIQGKRKKISAVTLRLANSRGMKVGPINQALYEIKSRGFIPMGQPEPMFTGDERVVMDPNFSIQGQISIVQDQPLPCTVLGFMPEISMGDN